MCSVHVYIELRVAGAEGGSRGWEQKVGAEGRSRGWEQRVGAEGWSREVVPEQCKQRVGAEGGSRGLYYC